MSIQKCCHSNLNPNNLVSYLITLVFWNYLPLPDDNEDGISGGSTFLSKMW